MINVAVGDAAIEFEGREYILRPSFYAMQRIGSPEEIKDVFEWCVSASVRIEHGLLLSRDELSACWHVLSSCCDEDIPINLFGYHDANDDGILLFIEGAEPVYRLAILANHLLKFGINGKPSKYMERKSKSAKGDRSTGFDPIEFVSAAVTNLNMPFYDAWNLHMIEFQRAMDNIMPDEDKRKSAAVMTEAELIALEERCGGVNNV